MDKKLHTLDTVLGLDYYNMVILKYQTSTKPKNYVFPEWKRCLWFIIHNSQLQGRIKDPEIFLFFFWGGGGGDQFYEKR